MHAFQSVPPINRFGSRAQHAVARKFAFIVILLIAHSAIGAGRAQAQAVPWTQKDIGTVQIPGSFTYAAGTPPTYTVQGTGDGNNGFSLVYTSTTGNNEIEARLVSQSSTSAYAFAGLQMTDSVNAGNTAGMVIIGVQPGLGLAFYCRSDGGSWTGTYGPAIYSNVYLRLVRSGTTVSGYYSTDGSNWTLLNSYTASFIMPTPYYAGFFVDSNGVSALNTGVFDHVSFMTNVPQTTPNMLLWLRSDVGVTSSSGSVSNWADQSGNGLTVTQSSSSLQPSLVTGALNSGVLPAITFDGSSQYLSTGSDFANLSNGASIFAVTQPQSSTATGDLCAFGNTSNSDAIIAQAVGTQASLSANNGTTSSSVTTTSNPLSTSQYQLLEETFQPGATTGSGTGTIWVNGVQQAQSTSLVQTLNNVTRTQNFIGTGIGLSNYFGGGIAEILVYNTPLSVAQRQSIETYIYSKYGVGNKITLDTPSFSPGPGIWPASQSVALSQDQGALIYYSTDGSTPDPSTSPLYNGTAISVTSNETIKALATLNYYNNSAVGVAPYQIDSTTSPIARSGLVLWLRADNSVTYNGSNQVSQWSDVSGSQNSFSQSTSSYQPIWTANAINGLPALAFNGSSQFLQAGQFLSDLSTGASLILVTKPTSVSAGARLLDLENCSLGTYLSFLEPSTNAAQLNLYNANMATSLSASTAVTPSQFQLLEAFNAGLPGSGIYTNSVLNTNSALAMANNYLGQASASGNYFNGELAELLLYNRALTSSEQSSLEGYLSTKYNIMLAYNISPPIISVPGGALTGPTPVALEAPAAATIHITTDGSQPTVFSPVYSGPINVSFSQTIKAIAVVNGISSATASASYTLNSTQWCAPSSGDSTPLRINLQLPTATIP